MYTLSECPSVWHVAVHGPQMHEHEACRVDSEANKDLHQTQLARRSAVLYGGLH